MTLLDILMAAAGVSPEKIRAIILAGMAASPDLAPEGQKILDKLNAAVSNENILAVIGDIAEQGKKLAQGKVDPKFHPGDYA